MEIVYKLLFTSPALSSSLDCLDDKTSVILSPEAVSTYTVALTIAASILYRGQLHSAVGQADPTVGLELDAICSFFLHDLELVAFQQLGHDHTKDDVGHIFP